VTPSYPGQFPGAHAAEASQLADPESAGVPVPLLALVHSQQIPFDGTPIWSPTGRPWQPRSQKFSVMSTLMLAHRVKTSPMVYSDRQERDNEGVVDGREALAKLLARGVQKARHGRWDGFGGRK